MQLTPRVRIPLVRMTIGAVQNFTTPRWFTISNLFKSSKLERTWEYGCIAPHMTSP